MNDQYIDRPKQSVDVLDGDKFNMIRNIEKMRKLYFAGESDQAIASKCDSNKSTIVRWRNKNQYPANRKVKKHLELIKKRLAAGDSNATIAKELDVSFQSIHYWRQKMAKGPEFFTKQNTTGRSQKDLLIMNKVSRYVHTRAGGIITKQQIILIDQMYRSGWSTMECVEELDAHQDQMMLKVKLTL